MNALPQQSSPVQVAPDHYRSGHYDELHRWISYWYQIQAIVRSGARTVLEIGVGSGVLSTYLRARLGLTVTTCDFDSALQPDIVADVRALDQKIAAATYDAVVAFQVLEHLPYSDFTLALQQLKHASAGSVIISLPHYGYPLQWRFKFWRWSGSFGRKISKNPLWAFNGEHHWEIGTRGHSLATVRSAIENQLSIQRAYFCPDYPYHYFFESRRRDVPQLQIHP